MMSLDDVEQRLRDALHADADQVVLVNPDHPPTDGGAWTLPPVEPRRPSIRRLAAVAAAVLLVATASVVALRKDPPAPTPPPEPTAPADVDDLFDGLTVGAAPVFTDIPPGRTVDLPPAPISERDPSALAWTGTELLVWGGHDAESAALMDGAAFDLATGTWRTLAPAPIEPRRDARAVWTGTELLVWGGTASTGGDLLDGGAYDPSTDTWRPLPEAPFRYAQDVVWTGEEMVIFGRYQMAAFDPDTDTWHELAAPLPGTTGLISSGETFLAIVYPDPAEVDYPAGGEDMGDFPVGLARYERSSDTWERLPFETVVADHTIDVTGPDGVTRAIVVYRPGTGAEVTMLDPAGEVVGTLPSVPDQVFDAAWTGEELLFSALGPDSVPWALNLASQTWRALSVDEVPPSFGRIVIAPEAGVILRWGGLDGPPSGIYRPPSPAAG